MSSKDDEARRSRLMEARVAQGYRSARNAAEKLGLNESTYRAHENGSRVLTQPSAILYAQRLNITFDWLWHGKGDMLKVPTEKDFAAPNSASHNAALPVIQFKDQPALLPVRGRGQGGSGGEIVLDGTIVQRLPGPSTLSEEEGAYGLEVVGESMLNRYRPREIVWVDPRRSVHRGDNAVFQVRMPNGELHAFIKEFVRFSDGQVIACQYNPEAELKWDRDDVEAIHLIVGTGLR